MRLFHGEDRFRLRHLAVGPAAMSLFPTVGAIAGGASLLLWVLSVPPSLARAAARCFPGIFFKADTKEKMVALTIDDGPHPDVTPGILDALREHGCRCTFFLIGENCVKYPELVDRIVSDGHEMANHTMRDFPSWRLGASELESEVLELEGVFHQHKRGWGAPSSVKWFRPGCGWFTKGMLAVVQRLGYRVALGTLYFHDVHFHSASVISRVFLQRLHPGAVIILHDGHPSRLPTVEVLHSLLPKAKERGYEVLTLSEMAGRCEGGWAGAGGTEMAAGAEEAERGAAGAGAAWKGDSGPGGGVAGADLAASAAAAMA